MLFNYSTPHSCIHMYVIMGMAWFGMPSTEPSVAAVEQSASTPYLQNVHNSIFVDIICTWCFYCLILCKLVVLPTERRRLSGWFWESFRFNSPRAVPTVNIQILILNYYDM